MVDTFTIPSQTHSPRRRHSALGISPKVHSLILRCLAEITIPRHPYPTGQVLAECHLQQKGYPSSKLVKHWCLLSRRDLYHVTSDIVSLSLVGTSFFQLNCKLLQGRNFLSDNPLVLSTLPGTQQMLTK